MALLFDDVELRDRRLATLLQTATQLQQNQIAREELQFKKSEQDPRVQAGKLATTMAMLGQTEQAERLLKYANEGSFNLPSQGAAGLTQAPQQYAIPDYLSRGSLGINAGSVGLPTASPMGIQSPGQMGVTSGRLKVGGASLGFGKQDMDEISKANLDIHKQVLTEGIKKQQETKAGAQKTLGGLDVYLQQFKRSEEELKKYDPNIGSEGFEGKLRRIGGYVSEKLDELPETSAMIAMSKPFAQEIATDLEGRATDADRDIQIETMANLLKGPSSKNIRLASNAIINLQAKGADTKKLVAKLYNSGSDILVKAAEQVYEAYPELRDEPSNLKGLFDGI